jgi:glycosyltransferase involved in cell wall biosynthesis
VNRGARHDSTSRPTVTIGMPVFNGERYIRQAIDSVRAQTFEDFEFLISDNASTDATAAICREYAEKDRRIRLIRQEQNLGPFGNFKFVTDQASGDLLVWLAHDDVLEARFVEQTRLFMEQNPNAVLVCADVRVIDERGTETGIEELCGIREWIDWPRRCAEFFKFPISNVYLAIYGMMRTDVCRAALNAVRPPKYMAQIELPILARFAAAGEIASIPRVLRSYRRHDASLYHSEVSAMARKPPFKLPVSRWLHVGRLIFDQISLLLAACVRGRVKFAVLRNVANHYASRLVREL